MWPALDLDFVTNQKRKFDDQIVNPNWKCPVKPLRKHDTLNTLRPRQNGSHFADDIFKCIFLNENVWIIINISLKCVPKGPMDNIPSLVQIMVWRRPGAKPLSESMMVSLVTHICVTRPQWVKKTCNVFITVAADESHNQASLSLTWSDYNPRVDE